MGRTRAGLAVARTPRHAPPGRVRRGVPDVRIGLEFNLPKLRAMRRLVFGLGLAQVLLTLALATSGSLALAWLLPSLWTWAGRPPWCWRRHGHEQHRHRGQADGRAAGAGERARPRVMGVLLFQDLAVVPLLVLIPALGSPPEQAAGRAGPGGAEGGLLIALLLWGGQRC
jgi:CPA2 family monovalent cation:H+ antiporter-2